MNWLYRVECERKRQKTENRKQKTSERENVKTWKRALVRSRWRGERQRTKSMSHARWLWKVSKIRVAKRRIVSAFSHVFVLFYQLFMDIMDVDHHQHTQAAKHKRCCTPTAQRTQLSVEAGCDRCRVCVEYDDSYRRMMHHWYIYPIREHRYSHPNACPHGTHARVLMCPTLATK